MPITPLPITPPPPPPLPVRNVGIDGDARFFLNRAGYEAGSNCIQLVGSTNPFIEFSFIPCPTTGRAPHAYRLFSLPVSASTGHIFKNGTSIIIGRLQAFSDAVTLYDLCTGMYAGAGGCSIVIDDGSLARLFP